jgi:N6-L-threonylcarbamoyladenine synthase
MNILAIETSCDETAVAVVRDGRHIAANIVASQIALHSKYGGVVPELASRQHVLTIVPVLEEALSRAKAGWADLDAIAVTKGPGLAPALLVGINAAKAIAFSRMKPLIAVNHMEGHIYSNWLVPETDAASDKVTPEPAFPVLCLVVSGGHTELVLMTGHGEYRLLGKTVDDAAGEAFDKAARILGLGYPGGPAIQKAATSGDPASVTFPRSRLKGEYDFSFSGVKTALLRKVQEYGGSARKGQPWQIAQETPPQEVIGDTSLSADIAQSASHVESRDASESAKVYTTRPGLALNDTEGERAEESVKVEDAKPRELPVADLAASFQAAVVEMLVEKTLQAAHEYDVREVLVAGGVAANSALRARLAEQLTVPFRYPPLVLCTDNAAMIAAAAFYRYADGVQKDLSLDIEPNARYV